MSSASGPYMGLKSISMDADAGGSRRLCVVLDLSQDDAARSFAIAKSVLKAGCRWIQVRESAMTDRNRLSLLRRIADVAKAFDAWVFANDRPDMAILSGATGLHLGQGDVSIADARRLFAQVGMTDAMIGISASTREQAELAVANGAAYIGCGAVFNTLTKANAVGPIELSGLSEIASAVDIPVIAIGGITLERLPGVLSAGAAGVAVCSAIVASDDPGEATGRFLTGIQERLK
ncbi:thiamine phosphate synthase [bacterium]|nr:thiamine phosphate synthase [bacterium]